jgi:GTP-binding protein
VNIVSAEFVTSATSVDSCPATGYFEYAFIGRSNVGKSSLINMLLNKKGLAKTSGTPGKTQTINHFIVNASEAPWYVVDLPGYGYAKTSKKRREEWDRFVRRFLINRQKLICTFVLIDIRVKPQVSDMEFMEWMGENSLPFLIVFTKCDKLTKTEVEVQFGLYRERLLEVWNEMPDYFLTSATSRLGRDQILNFIDGMNKEITSTDP